MKEIKILTKSFDQSLVLPGSKSLTNRALIMAALCQKESQLNGILECDDTMACKEALNTLETQLPIKSIHCHEAGTVARFLLPVCAALGGNYRFDAGNRLRERPIKPLIQLLKQQAIEFEFMHNADQMPFMMHSSGMVGGNVSIDISDSSQFLSGLCISAPLTQKGMIIHTTQPIASKPYVMMTLKLMEQFGISHYFHDDTCIEIPSSSYQAIDLSIEPDASTASYFFAAAALTNSRIEIKHLNADSFQGDLKFLDILEKIGCRVSKNEHSIVVSGPQSLGSINTVDMSAFSDTFMTLAIMAPFLETPTTITGIRHTQYQESHRITSMASGLNQLNIRTETTDDSLTIFPGVPKGNTVQSYHDHRVAMAFSILGLKVPGIHIDDPHCVSKTCPLFFEYLEKLRG